MNWLVSSSVLLVIVLSSAGSLGGTGQEQKAPGIEDRPASHWIEVLKEKDPVAREKAVRALGTLGPKAKEAVPALIEALKDPEPEVSFAASRALGAVGAEAVPALTQAMKTKDSLVRVAAAQALGAIGPKAAAAAIPALTEALKDEDSLVRGAAVQALVQFGPEARAAAPVVSQLFLKEWSALLPPSGKVPGDDVLQRLLRERASRRLDAMVVDLKRMDPQGKLVVPALVDAVKHPDPQVRVWAIRMLGEFGPQAGEAAPVLIAALKDAPVRNYVPAVLAKVGRDPDTAIPAILELVRSEAQPVRPGAAELLAHFGPPAIPALEKALQDPNASIRILAVQTLSQLYRPEVVPPLAEALKDSDSIVRTQAALALGHVGWQAKWAAVPALIEATRDGNVTVRTQASQSLRQVDPRTANRVLQR